MKAIWRGTTLAESDETVVVEGNHYFPADSINRKNFRESETRTVCPWKGQASYYDVVMGEERKPRCRLVLSGTKERGRTDQGDGSLFGKVSLSSSSLTAPSTI